MGVKIDVVLRYVQREWMKVAEIKAD